MSLAVGTGGSWARLPFLPVEMPVCHDSRSGATGAALSLRLLPGEGYDPPRPVALATKIANEQGIPSIALSGGVAYNDHIASRIRELSEAGGCEFFVNHHVPCGDGGVSVGQAVYAGLGYRLAHASDDASEQYD